MSPATIATLAARIARVPDAEAHAGMPFSAMGLDSAGTIELAFAIEEIAGIDLPPEVVSDCVDARMLAAQIEARCSFRDIDSGTMDPFEAMLADASLPAAVRPPGGIARANPVNLATAHNILLTGATGFLGRWLARTLLEESHATLTCVVRGGRGNGRKRLGEALSTAGVGSNELERRIRIVEGDLSQPSCGMHASELDALGADVDAICHAGALVNWVLPYRALRAANVAGTRVLLELAARRGVPFHFVSSISVCYSTLAPSPVDERFDALPALRGLHLGYAQTKAVSEALVRQAGERGLPVTIYRPSFITGHSSSGTYNADDILARTVSGAVRMGRAPDLDWTLDCLPVDAVARAIVRSSDRRGVVHLTHSRPRHWRECVLWMRMYGYDVRLEPYHAWLRRLDRETSDDRSHPLTPLRSFFLGRAQDALNLTLPELMLRTNLARGPETPQPVDEPPLDAALLQRYFDAFVARDALPPTHRTGSTVGGGRPNLDTAFFTGVTGRTVTNVEYLGRLSDHSILSELTAWNSGRSTGLFRYRLHASTPDAATASRVADDVVVKIKPPDECTIAVGEALARLCDERLGDAYSRWRGRIGVVSAHVRELAVYEQRDERFRTHAPRLLGAAANPAGGTWTLVLERIADATLRDTVDRPDLWTVQDVECAIEGLAALHAMWYGREAELRTTPWIGYVPSASDMEEMSDLWRALAAHAGPRFSAWADPAIGSIQRTLIEEIERWWHPLETLPRTLIHNDFNPRNICLRNGPRGRALCAYDWELAAVGIPQHDLAEFLCFVLPPNTTRETVSHFVNCHRQHLERATATSIDRRDWQLGFQAALGDLMLNRLPMYALVHRVRAQSFLPRVARTWRRIYELC